MKTAVVLINWIGCPRNSLLKLRIEDYLRANGYMLVRPNKITESNLIVFCSCGFTLDQQRASLRIIRSVHEKIDSLAGPPQFIVTGCLPPINRKEVQFVHNGPLFGPLEIDAFDSLIGASVKIADVAFRTTAVNGERTRVLVERAYFKPKLALLKTAKSLNDTLSSANRLLLGKKLSASSTYRETFDSYQLGEKTWSVITSTGCLGTCSYCVIRLSKGALRSRPLDDVVAQARLGVEKGYKWISLIADDNGVYGKDIGTNFGILLRALSDIPGEFNILIDSLHPHHFIQMYDDIVLAMKAGKIRATLAIQHVNKRILKSMLRPYDVGDFKAKLEYLSREVEGMISDAHFIVGYPGETDEEFEELRCFAQWFLGLSTENSFKAFPFSANPNTVAATLPDQIPRPVIAKRVKIMSRLLIDRQAADSGDASRNARKAARSPFVSNVFQTIDSFTAKVNRKLASIEEKTRYGI